MMALLKKEQKEYNAVRARAKKNKIKVARVGPANLTFRNGPTVQLGTGSATRILDAKIKMKKKLRSK